MEGQPGGSSSTPNCTSTQSRHQGSVLSNEQAKLAAIAAHALYSHLGGDASWRRLALAEDAVAVLAAARRHECAGDLQELSSAYVDLLAERVVDAPAAVSVFPSLCAAVGESMRLLCPRPAGIACILEKVCRKVELVVSWGAHLAAAAAAYSLQQPSC